MVLDLFHYFYKQAVIYFEYTKKNLRTFYVVSTSQGNLIITIVGT